MKILRVVSSGFQEGGVENGIVLQQPYFQARGHETRILSSDLRPELPHFNDYSFRAPGRMKLFHTFNPYAYRALRRAIGEWRPDIVHLHTIGAASPAIFFALGGAPTVASVHGPEGYTRSLMLWNHPKTDFSSAERSFETLTMPGRMRYAYYRYVNYPIFRVGLARVDRFVTYSAYMRDLMRSEGIESEYVPNAAEIFEYRPLYPGRIAPSLLCVGRLEAFKGVDYLLRALPAISARYPGVRLRIAGEGSERQALQSLSESLGVSDRVAFLGNCGRAELAAEYERASVVVMPSVWPEAFGKVGIEAMSVGRPVVATDVGGIRDWLQDGENGRIVKARDAGGIAEACMELFQDTMRIGEMGACARAVAETFSVEKHVERMESLYGDVIERKRASPTTLAENSEAMREI